MREHLILANEEQYTPTNRRFRLLFFVRTSITNEPRIDTANIFVSPKSLPIILGYDL